MSGHLFLLRLATLTALLCGAHAHSAGSDIGYFNTKDDAVAACIADAAQWNTGCIPDTPSYTSWCNTYSQGTPGPNLASYSRVLQQYQPVPPSQNCYTPISTTYVAYAWPKTACASGTQLVGPTGYDCLAPTVIQQAADSQKQLGTGVPDDGLCRASTLYGNPCDASTGNKLQRETDFAGGDGIPAFVRTYNSLAFSNSARFGAGWMHSQMRFLAFGSGTVTVVRGDGQREVFTSAGSGVWVGQADSRRRVTQSPQGYTVEYSFGNTEFYSPDGRLLTETDRFGRVTSYAYSSGILSSITGPYGHKITFTTLSNGYKVTFPSGWSANYIRDANFNLTTIQYQDSATTYNTVRTFKYENTGLPHALTGIVDELGNRVSTYTYDAAAGRAARTEQAGGMRRFDFSYSGSQTTVTDAAGSANTLTFQRNLGVNNLVQRAGADGKTLSQTFDGSNNLVSRTDEEGRSTTFTYDAANRVSSITAAAGTPQTRTTSITYADPFLELPAIISVPSVAGAQAATTTITYTTNKLPATITRTGFDPAGTPVSRSIAIAYTSDGHVASIDGPRTDVSDVWTFDYWNCTTGGKCGQLKRVTNPLGQSITFDAYTAGGLLSQKTDPNGLVTTYSYDTRDRLLSITETPLSGNARTTSFTYNKAGDLITASLPGGTVLTYAYSTAHDLVSVTDNLGNKVSYSYDLRGNRVQEKVMDSALVLARQVDWTFDVRNRVASTNLAGSLTQTVFDTVGNLTAITDPNGHSTSMGYDPLNRIIQSVNALGGAASLDYDAGGALTSVASPNGAAWLFSHDDLGNELSESSPDRGAVARTFDAAGNAVSRTDARGISATFAYDALNRLASISYPDPTENVSLTWDSCTGGVRRLCAVSDASGIRAWAYDGFGRVVSETWTTAGHAYTTSYAWNPDDSLASITYPSGRAVSFSRNVLGQITAVASGGANIVSARSYRPDGLLKAQTFGNGLVESRSYDLQGRMTAWSAGSVLSRAFAYDPAGNLVQKDSASFQYDAIDRLVSEPAQILSYDGNGNRLSDAAGAYSYSPASNRMTTGPPGAVSLDAAGNTTAIGAMSFGYNQAGRMASASVAGQAASYAYRFDGLRASKSVGGATTLFHYDLDGRLIAETDASGATLREYVWDDDGRPLVMFAGGVITYLHADPLGTPRLGTSAAGAEVWRWDSDAFGAATPSGPATVNLRFPGQYFDAETGLHYNGQRSYHPASGRYLESDPIGLAAGVNTYGYVGGNALRYVDPLGLDWTDSVKSWWKSSVAGFQSDTPADMVSRVLQGFPAEGVFVAGVGAIKSIAVLERCATPVAATAANYRLLFLKARPDLPAGWAVHHSIPQRYEEMMRAAGINIHNVQFLRGVSPQLHSKITTEWERFHRAAASNPTPAQVAEFAKLVDTRYGGSFVWPGF